MSRFAELLRARIDRQHLAELPRRLDLKHGAFSSLKQEGKFVEVEVRLTGIREDSQEALIFIKTT